MSVSCGHWESWVRRLLEADLAVLPHVAGSCRGWQGMGGEGTWAASDPAGRGLRSWATLSCGCYVQVGAGTLGAAYGPPKPQDLVSVVACWGWEGSRLRCPDCWSGKQQRALVTGWPGCWKPRVRAAEGRGPSGRLRVWGNSGCSEEERHREPLRAGQCGDLEQQRQTELIHRGLNKVGILQTMFQMHFHKWKILYLDSGFTEICFWQ